MVGLHPYKQDMSQWEETILWMRKAGLEAIQHPAEILQLLVKPSSGFRGLGQKCKLLRSQSSPGELVGSSKQSWTP